MNKDDLRHIVKKGVEEATFDVRAVDPVRKETERLTNHIWKYIEKDMLIWHPASSIPELDDDGNSTHELLIKLRLFDSNTKETSISVALIISNKWYWYENLKLIDLSYINIVEWCELPNS